MLVRELLSLDALQPISSVTGEEGLDNAMKDVVLLEYDSLQQPRPKDYYLDDFIISTLFSAKDDPGALYAMVEQLISLGAVGLAYKSVYFKTIPPEVIALAKAHHFPILKFDGLYIEDVILTISDSMRMRQEFSMFEEPLFQLLRGGADTYGIESLCMQMNPNRKKYMCAVYVHSTDLTCDWSITLRNVLQLRSSRHIISSYRFLQFRRGFFILCNDTQPMEPKAVARDMLRLFDSLGVEYSHLCFGIGTVQQRSADFDRVIRDAFDALLYAITQNKTVATMDELRMYQCIFPMIRDKTTREQIAAIMARLENYDQESSSGCLVATLDAYSSCHYSIPDTATLLHQHPNTIRYRLKKIAELACGTPEADHGIFLLGEFRRIDALSIAIF